MSEQYAIIHGLDLINPEYKNILEFGVYKGDSIKRIRDHISLDYKVYGFDSFIGLPEDWRDSTNKLVGRGHKGRFTTNGEIPKIDNIKFYKGWFNDTIPNYLNDEGTNKIGLIHIDCDIYSSTKTILEMLNDYIIKDTILVFDEWIYNHNKKYNDHEQRAFYEWVEKYDREYKIIEFRETSIRDLSGDSEKKIIKIIK